MEKIIEPEKFTWADVNSKQKVYSSDTSKKVLLIWSPMLFMQHMLIYFNATQ